MPTMEIKIGNKFIGPFPSILSLILLPIMMARSTVLCLIDLAKSSGADAVKFQHHNVNSISHKGFVELGASLVINPLGEKYL